MVSARVSPLEAEVEEGSEKPNTLPPRRIIAVWKEKQVLVLGSKKRDAMTLPRQESAKSWGLAMMSRQRE
jgi:hypothetical protein